jgi:hypothetical protein
MRRERIFFAEMLGVSMAFQSVPILPLAFAPMVLLISGWRYCLYFTGIVSTLNLSMNPLLLNVWSTLWLKLWAGLEAVPLILRITALLFIGGSAVMIILGSFCIDYIMANVFLLPLMKRRVRLVFFERWLSKSTATGKSG